MLLYLPGDVMNLINERNSGIVDVYNTSISDISYNIDKFKELSSYSNLKLDKEFICLNKYNKYILNCKHHYSILFQHYCLQVIYLI